VVAAKGSAIATPKRNAACSAECEHGRSDARIKCGEELIGHAVSGRGDALTLALPFGMRMVCGAEQGQDFAFAFQYAVDVRPAGEARVGHIVVIGFE
jgi:hypothetical protein